MTKHNRMIPYGHQDISEEDIAAVRSVLLSDYLTQGGSVAEFEKSIADYCGAPFAVAVNSATSALHIACLALGLKSGDLVWTSPITFLASANCALYCGSNIDFVDVDAKNGNLCVSALEDKLRRASVLGRLPKIVIPVHLCGQSCDMRAINRLSKIYGFSIIEDASHAIGGKFFGKKIGGCEYSDITVFSFHPVKIITTGEGGMAVTRSEALAKKMQLLRSHGVTRNPLEMMKESDGPWYYEQIELGFNYRLTDIQAALGTSQARRIDKFVSLRNLLAGRYTTKLTGLPVEPLQQMAYNYSSYHLYVVRLSGQNCFQRRRIVVDRLRQLGIGANVHYIPIHLQPYFQRFGFRRGDFPESEAYYEKAFSLPIYPTLTDEQQDYVIASLKSALEE